MTAIHTEKARRNREALERELGETILDALGDPDITEVMLNGDGQLWIDSLARGLVPAGGHMSRIQALSLITTVAGLLDRIVDAEHPVLEVPLDGSQLGTVPGTNAGLPIREIVAGGPGARRPRCPEAPVPGGPGANLSTADACSGGGGTASNGTRFESTTPSKPPVWRRRRSPAPELVSRRHRHQHRPAFSHLQPPGPEDHPPLRPAGPAHSQHTRSQPRRRRALDRLPQHLAQRRTGGRETGERWSPARLAANHLYAYGPGDRRLVTLDTLDTLSNVATYHLRNPAGQVVREVEVTGSGNQATFRHQKDLIYGPDGLLATVTQTGEPHYFHKDHLGTPRVVTDAGGT